MQKKEDNGEAIAQSMLTMAKLKVPIICVVIGEGSSGGALALGVGDRIIMLENAVYSILSPEGFASILYKDASKSQEAAEKMKMTAKDLQNLKVIDKIVNEPENGVQEETIQEVAQELKKYFIKEIKQLQKKEENTLLEERYQKFRKIGTM